MLTKKLRINSVAEWEEKVPVGSLISLSYFGHSNINLIRNLGIKQSEYGFQYRFPLFNESKEMFSINLLRINHDPKLTRFGLKLERNPFCFLYETQIIWCIAESIEVLYEDFGGTKSIQEFIELYNTGYFINVNFKTPLTIDLL